MAKMTFIGQNDLETIRKYVLAGQATFTLVSSKIDKRYTYKIVALHKYPGQYKCYVMWGDDNTKDYRYCGVFRSENMQLHTKYGNLHKYTHFKMLRQFLSFLTTEEIQKRGNRLPDTCDFYRSRYCARCGHLLTTPESIKTGYGRICQKYVEEAYNI